MGSKFTEAKRAYSEATARFQAAIRKGTTEEMTAALDAQSAAFAAMTEAGQGRLSQMERVARRFAEAA